MAARRMKREQITWTVVLPSRAAAKVRSLGRKPQEVPKRPLRFPVPSPNRGDRRARPRLTRAAPSGLKKLLFVVSLGPGADAPRL